MAAAVGGAALRPAVAHGGERPGPIAAVSYRDPYWASHIGGRFDADWRLYREGSEVLIVGSSVEAYDVEDDPTMQEDLSASEVERGQALLARARDYFAKVPEGRTQPVEVSEDLRERLRELGYAR